MLLRGRGCDGTNVDIGQLQISHMSPWYVVCDSQDVTHEKMSVLVVLI